MLIDLSLPVKNGTNEPDPPRIRYFDHRREARRLIRGAVKMAVKKSPVRGFVFGLSCFFAGLTGRNKTRRPRPKLPSLSLSDFPGQAGLANEELTLDPHSGTHLDSPWHFGPLSAGAPSMTVDRIPLEWCYGDGVVLDLRHKRTGEFISETDVSDALGKIGYTIKPFDIVLIMTGADRHFDSPEYFSVHPGMDAGAVKWLASRGVKVMGIDAWGFDRPAGAMLADFLRTGDNRFIFPAHFAGREVEYCHLEKLANLDKIPRPFGFKVICFPVKIENASAGWCRTVAVV